MQDTTGRYGFGTPEIIVDRPDDHHMVVPDPYGGTVDFGAAVNTILQTHTGCHLPPVAQRSQGLVSREPDLPVRASDKMTT